MFSYSKYAGAEQGGIGGRISPCTINRRVMRKVGWWCAMATRSGLSSTKKLNNNDHSWFPILRRCGYSPLRYRTSEDLQPLANDSAQGDNYEQICTQSLTTSKIVQGARAVVPSPS